MKHTLFFLGVGVLSLSLISCGSEAKSEEILEPADTSVSLFDGETLKGWHALKEENARFWSVVDGCIEASNGAKKMPLNTYLVSDQEYENFEFSCKFRLSGDPKTGVINSGIQYRSLVEMHAPKRRKKDQSDAPPVKVPTIIGYQADIGENWWGGIFDEHRRRKLVKGDAEALLASEGFTHDGWHDYRIVCKGNHHQLYIDGFLTADYMEENAKIPSKGVLALQLHKGGVAKIQYKDIKLLEL